MCKPNGAERFFEEDFNLYLVVGGMPECVKYFTETNDLPGVKNIQDDLLYSYEQDFKKYKPAINPDCLLDILENGTKHIGNQVIYTKLSARFTSPTIKKGFDLLRMAPIALRCTECVGRRFAIDSFGQTIQIIFFGCRPHAPKKQTRIPKPLH